MMDRVEVVHDNLLRRIAADDLPPGPPPSGPLTSADALALFGHQCLSRALDRQARVMQRAGHGYYTIGSSGHEGTAAVAHALRPDDPAFLHYRDAAFFIARASQLPGQDPAMDLLLSFACSTDDPISGGRHKVLGSRKLSIPPQTSTIASHLPKAVGAAYSMTAARRNRPEHAVYRDDGVIVCSFGDASANHATAQAAFNTASWTSFQSIPMPTLFVCEDNGIGISVKTPSGWIEAAFGNRPGLRYFAANGLDLFEAYRVATEAANYVRTTRKPAFLHLRTIRLYGHAGADVAATYLSRQEIEATEADDPLLHSVRLLRDAEVCEPTEAGEIYRRTVEQVAAAAEVAVSRPRLDTADAVMASIVPPLRACRPVPDPTDEDRRAAFGGDLSGFEEPQPMARLIGWGLTDIMLQYGEVVIMGEDVGRKGGVYGVTQKLQARFGPNRVVDTLLDETSILGMAIGMAHNGFVPVPEIQFLAYYHNAEDQVRGEAATLPFFSQGQFTNPMVVRIAGLGYQKGFGGHFHNDNSVAVLRDIPGLILACPSNGRDAVLMLRESIRLAREEQRVVVFLEPIALYQERDIEPGDGAWLHRYPDGDESIGVGQVGIHGTGTDVAIVSFGNGLLRARRAKARLAEQGIDGRVIDLRWLAPLPIDAVVDAIGPSRQVVVVDETRASGGVSEGLMADLIHRCEAPVDRIAAEDSFVATGPAYAATMPSTDDIVETVTGSKAAR